MTRYFCHYVQRTEFVNAVTQTNPWLLPALQSALTRSNAGGGIALRYVLTGDVLTYHDCWINGRPFALPLRALARLVTPDNLRRLREEASQWERIVSRPPPFGFTIHDPSPLKETDNVHRAHHAGA